MALNTYTNELMKALPAALRPNPHAIDENVMEAIANGWTIPELAAAAYTKDRNPTPAFVVTNIRNLAKYAPTQTKATNTTGPCQLGCDHGWHDSTEQPGKVVPCRTCRPDTYRRVVEREAARANGASLNTMAQIMIDTASPTPVPHTYWTN